MIVQWIDDWGSLKSISLILDFCNVTRCVELFLKLQRFWALKIKMYVVTLEELGESSRTRMWEEPWGLDLGKERRLRGVGRSAWKRVSLGRGRGRPSWRPRLQDGVPHSPNDGQRTLLLFFAPQVFGGQQRGPRHCKNSPEPLPTSWASSLS